MSILAERLGRPPAANLFLNWLRQCFVSPYRQLNQPLNFDRLLHLARFELTRLKAGDGYFRPVSGGMENRVCRWIGFRSRSR